MYESPHSLQETCIQYICENIHAFCTEPKTESLLGSSDVYLPSNVSERLLAELADKQKLCDEILMLFDEKLTWLQQVKISNASKLTSKGLSILRHHKISHLEVRNLAKLNVNELIGCLGEWSLHNLESLNVSHCTFQSNNKICVVVALSKLKNLSYLNVSNTEFSLRGLDIVTQDLPLLEKLDISDTIIRDITPLKKCKHRLKSLNMYNLKILNFTDFLSVLQELNNLRYLDISDERGDPFTLASRNNSKMTEFLRCGNCCLPCLSSLDISGNDGIHCDDLRYFLKTHPSLEFLGLMMTEACFFDIFTKETDECYNPNLKVAGYATFSQIVCSLERYLPRRTYIQKSLYYLYSSTQTLQETRLDVIKLVLRGMSKHPKTLGLQMAATACLYNLTKGSFVTSVHPHWLRKIVNLTLIAMKNFPSHQQLQKNALLTLCSDRILQEVTFDKYQCAECVMEALVSFNDPSMNRMSAAICSILSSKISTSQTSALGTNPFYMERLLSIVQTMTEASEVDIMMKFTLSALWNLTDESPATCSAFLKMDGLELFLKVLNTFSGECNVETKVLGLVNNIAEVSHLRPHLMKDEFIVALRSLLHSSHVDVSYFAAGIVAHLASDDPSLWTCTVASRKEMLQELGEVVRKWHTPETEMVAYRSFMPFLPLLKCYQTPEVQLWAVWAIHHVCSKNPKRYAPMLKGENGVNMIEDLLRRRSVDPSVLEVCQKILEISKKPYS